MKSISNIYFIWLTDSYEESKNYKTYLMVISIFFSYRKVSSTYLALIKLYLGEHYFKYKNIINKATVQNLERIVKFILPKIESSDY